MTLRMTMLPGLLTLGLALSGCAKSLEKPLTVRPVVSQCPAWPAPPAELMKPPVKTDFLSLTD